MATVTNKRKSSDIADSAAEAVVSNEKNPPSTNEKQNVVNKSSVQEFVQSEEAKTSSKDQRKNDKRKRRRKAGKPDGTEKREAETRLKSNHIKNKEKVKDERGDRNKRNGKFDKRIGGIIFMCSAKTKPDCFRYRLMGVSSSKQELVMGIKPGLKLFLFDFDLKFMYGIYEAASNGGMKLEPRAFGGAFPAQVRFNIVKDCLPLTEGIFKKAIKENYDEKTHKFKTELTVEQVKRLSELFHPVPLLHPIAKPSVQELVQAPVGQTPCHLSLSREETLSRHHYVEHQCSKLNHGSVPFDHDDHITPNNLHSSHPLFLTEKEYRSYGLQTGRHPLPTAASDGPPTSLKFDSYRADHVKEQLPSNLTSAGVNATMIHKDTGRSDLFFLSEKEYRTFGLKGCQESLTRIIPTTETNLPSEDSVKDVCNPYDDSTASLVNRYLSLPRTGSVPAESYYPTGRGTYSNNSSYMLERRDHLGILNSDPGKPFSPYASSPTLDHNQNYQRLVDEPSMTYTTVSSRYSFAGPPVSHH